MKEIIIKTFYDFQDQLAGMKRSCLCRGVTDASFDLTPSLFRNKDSEDNERCETNMMWVFKTKRFFRLSV